MEFRYQYKMQASDLWQMSMYYANSSILLVVNVICAASALLLLCAFWDRAGLAGRWMLLFFAALLPVIQPFAVWLRSVRQLRGNDRELALIFNREGLHITLEREEAHKKWSQIRQVAVKPTLVILYVDNYHGYLLPNRVLGESRKELLQFIRRQMAEMNDQTHSR